MKNIANDYEIEKSFLEALGLGSTQAAYELGKIYDKAENEEQEQRNKGQ